MDYLIIILAILTFVSTLIGGLVTLRFRNTLPYFFAFAAGTLIAVAFLDILPETLEVSQTINFPIRYIMITVVVSFFMYSFLDKYFVTHCIGDHCGEHGHIMGPIGAGSLVLHSLLDGAAIGTAFQISPSTGLAVALAVIFHDFTDGINTVTIMLKNKQKIRRALLFLIMDALAPILGVLLITFLNLPLKALVVILAVFVGEFIYLGAASLLPETREYPSKKTLLAMALGMLIIAVLTAFI